MAVRDGAGRAIRHGGTTLRDYVERRGRARLLPPGPVRLRTRGPAVPALRDADPPGGPGPAVHLLLPPLPGLTAGYGLRSLCRNALRVLCGAGDASHNARMSRPEPTRILLGVTGGIAAYKSAELVRRLRERGAEVQVVMTAARAQFVTPLTFQAAVRPRRAHRPVGRRGRGRDGPHRARALGRRWS